MKHQRPHYRNLLKFVTAEKYALELYKNRANFSSKLEIVELCKKRFPANKFVLLAVESAAESWNYHDETGPWYRDLQEQVGVISYNDLKWARNYDKYTI